MTTPRQSRRPPADKPFRRRRLGIWIGVCSLLVVLPLLVTGKMVLNRAGPILKGRIEETLTARFDSRVELDGLNVSILRGLEVSDDGLRIYAPDSVIATGAGHACPRHGVRQLVIAE